VAPPAVSRGSIAVTRPTLTPAIRTSELTRRVLVLEKSALTEKWWRNGIDLVKPK
jgi:hypothetical protein